MSASGSPLVDRVRDRLASGGASTSPAAVAAAVRAEGRVLGDAQVHRLVGTVRADLVGAGPLQPLLDDPLVTDVLVNGATSVWVDRGAGLEPAAVRFADDDEVRLLAVRLAAATGRRLDDASPYVDARMPDGVRLHAVLPPIALEHPYLSLRIPRRQVFTLEELVTVGALVDGAEAWLRAIVRSRAAFLVSGGTGTGKTTLLNALLSLVPTQDRIVIVEDAAELAPDHPHVVHLQARHANAEGAGEVGPADLVRQALRMRPDRVVVGEARGAEVVDLLAAMNTGHEGGCGTLHANGPEDVPARIAALAGLGGLDRSAAMLQLAAAVDVVLHLVRGSDGRRRLGSIGVLVGIGSDVRIDPALAWDDRGSCSAGPGLEALRRIVGGAGAPSCLAAGA